MVIWARKGDGLFVIEVGQLPAHNVVVVDANNHLAVDFVGDVVVAGFLVEERLAFCQSLVLAREQLEGSGVISLKAQILGPSADW